MDEHPEWHVKIELFGEEEVIFARATLHTQHLTLVGHGAARPCAGVRAGARMGDSVAVGAALQDLGRQLANGSARAHGRPARSRSMRRQTRDQHVHHG